MKALLLANPASGKEKIDKIVTVSKKRFQEQGYELEVYFSNSQGDLTDKAELWSTDYDMYLVCGGDGTVHEVINGVMKSDVRPTIAVIPNGTINDIARILKIPRNIDKNLDLIFSSEPVEMDINKINDSYFTYVCGAGYLTEISYMAKREEKKKYGSLAYLKTGLKGLRIKPDFKVRVEANGEVREKKVSLILILAANQFGGLRLWRFSRKTKLNDGVIDIRMFSGRKTALMFRLAWFVILAGKRQLRETHISTNKATITPLEGYNLIWNADGEKAEEGKVEIEVIPRAIRIYAHKSRIKKLF